MPTSIREIFRKSLQIWISEKCHEWLVLNINTEGLDEMHYKPQGKNSRKEPGHQRQPPHTPTKVESVRNETEHACHT